MAGPGDGRDGRGAARPRVRMAAGLLALAALAAVAPRPAAAQVETAISLDSDYRLRGFSLTDRRPAASLNLGYEDPSGAYAGATLVAADTRPKDIQLLGHIEYAGYAHRFASGRALDVGVQHTNLSSFGAGRRTPVHYTEVYVGLSDQVFSLRVHYSPDYIRPHVEVVYFDANAVLRPIERWRVFGHLGVSQTVSALPPGAASRRQDVRVGVAREIPHGDVRLEWSTTGPTPVRPGAPPPPSSDALVAGLSVFF